jgi:hypothetical protein
MAAPIGEIYGALSMVADSRQNYEITLNLGGDLLGKIYGRVKRRNLISTGTGREWRFEVTTPRLMQDAVILGYMDIKESSVENVEITRSADGSIRKAKIMAMV